MSNACWHAFKHSLRGKTRLWLKKQERTKTAELLNKDHHLILLRSYLTYDFFFEAVFTIPIIPQVLQYSANITAF